MLNSHLWDEVAKAALVIPQRLILADFDQFGAVHDTYCGSPVTVQPEHSDLLYELVGGRRLELTENKRSDPELFEFVRRTKHCDLQAMLAEARAAYPVRGECRYSLSISHAKRMEVNRRENLKAKCLQDSPIYFEAPPAKGDNAAVFLVLARVTADWRRR